MPRAGRQRHAGPGRHRRTAGQPHAGTSGGMTCGWSCVENTSMLDTVGFIGLGLMGKPMAANLIKRGFPLVVYSRSPGPVGELVAMGAARAASPEDVARRATRVITMLP